MRKSTPYLLAIFSLLTFILYREFRHFEMTKDFTAYQQRILSYFYEEDPFARMDLADMDSVLQIESNLQFESVKLNSLLLNEYSLPLSNKILAYKIAYLIRSQKSYFRSRSYDLANSIIVRFRENESHDAIRLHMSTSDDVFQYFQPYFICESCPDSARFDLVEGWNEELNHIYQNSDSVAGKVFLRFDKITSPLPYPVMIKRISF